MHELSRNAIQATPSQVESEKLSIDWEVQSLVVKRYIQGLILLHPIRRRGLRADDGRNRARTVGERSD